MGRAAAVRHLDPFAASMGNPMARRRFHEVVEKPGREADSVATRSGRAVCHRTTAAPAGVPPGGVGRAPPLSPADPPPGPMPRPAVRLFAIHAAP